MTLPELSYLEGGVAVISGGAAGIGLAVAQHCVRTLHMQVFLADISRDALNAAVSALGAEHAIGIVTDVSKWDSVCELFDEVVHKRHQQISFLFCNAGLGLGGSVTDASLQDWSIVLGVNLMGVVHCLRAFVPQMKKHPERRGCIAITASMLGIVSLQVDCVTWNSAPYNVSKVATVAIAEELAKEIRECLNLSCHVLCPGIVSTNIVRNSQAQKDAPINASKVDIAVGKAIVDFYRKRGLSLHTVVSTLFEGIACNRFCIPVEDGSDILANVRQKSEDIITGRQPTVPRPSPYILELNEKVSIARSRM